MRPPRDSNPEGALHQSTSSGSRTTMVSEQNQLRNALSKYVGLGEWARAVQILLSLIYFDPSNTNYYLRLGDYSLKAGDKDGAIQYYYTAAELYVEDGFSVKAIGTYKMILKIAPGETLAPILMKRAEAQKQQVMRDEPRHSEVLQRCLQTCLQIYHEVGPSDGGTNRGWWIA